MLSFSDLKKNLKKDKTGLKLIKVALLADSASQFMHTAIKGYGVSLNIDFDIFEAEYNQIERQVYDPTSELYSFNPAFIIIIRSTEHLLSNFNKTEEQANFADSILSQTQSIHRQLLANTPATVIINTYVEIDDAVFGNYAAKTNASFLYQLRKVNIGLMELAQNNKDLFITDLASLSAFKGYEHTFDPKMYISADMVFNIDFLPLMAQSVVQVINAATGNFKKCLVLDLDNTVWGGIIGDDGMEGIEIGSLGIGKAFTEFQLWCKQLKNRGIILAVSSKNTEEIAKEPFEHHPDMVLKLDDIAVFNANWDNKVDNITHIQSVLNIGFDSMVFLDDNPFEREMVRSAISELTVPELPEDPAEYLLYLRALNLFETSSFTAGDKDRTIQYQQEARRSKLQHSFANEHDYLKSLGMQAEVKSFNKFNIPRITQLIQRSNQFNLRTVRHSESEITTISGSAEYFTISVSLSDKFGDHGLIAIVILKKLSADVLFIDTWIMSCRVLKRGVEDLVLNSIVQTAGKNGFKKIVGEYILTKKNGLVKDHYQNLGFTNLDGNWELAVDGYNERKNFIHEKLQ